jgi:hypothetical protein
MMGSKKNSSAESRIESVSLAQCICQGSLDTTALIPIAPLQQESWELAFVNDTLASFAPAVVLNADDDYDDDYTPPASEPRRHSQSVQCILLI